MKYRNDNIKGNKKLMPENKLLDQALLTLKGCVDSSTVTNIDRLKVAICGEPKTGKSSVIARTARKPLIHYDFDDRKESIAGIPDTYVKTIYDKTDTSPTAWSEFESDIGTLEYLKEKKELPFKSIAVDSITFLRKYAEHQMLKDSTTSRAKFKIGSTEYLVPKDWDAINAVQHMMDTIFNRIFSLDIDVYATFHTRLEKDQNKSTTLNIVYKDTLTIDPPNMKMLLPKFNDCWRTYVDGGKYMIQMKPDWMFNAATVLKNVGDNEVADIQALLLKHNKNGAK
jgi:AAA domain